MVEGPGSPRGRSVPFGTKNTAEFEPLSFEGNVIGFSTTYALDIMSDDPRCASRRLTLSGGNPQLAARHFIAFSHWCLSAMFARRNRPSRTASSRVFSSTTGVLSMYDSTGALPRPTHLEVMVRDVPMTSSPLIAG